MPGPSDILGAPRVWSAGLKCIAGLGILVLLGIIATYFCELYVAVNRFGERWTLMDSSGSLYLDHEYTVPAIPRAGPLRWDAGRVSDADSPSANDSDNPNSGKLYESYVYEGTPTLVGGALVTPTLTSRRFSLFPALYFMGAWMLCGYLRNWKRWYTWKGNRFPVEVKP